MKKLFVFITLFCTFHAGAQLSKTDSLLGEVYKAKSEPTKLDIILALCGQNDINLDTFYHYAFVAKELADRTGDNLKIANAGYYVAYANYMESDNDNARKVIDEVLKKLNSESKEGKKIYYKLKCFKALTYSGQHSHEEALKILYPLLSEAEKAKDNLYVANIMHHIAIVEGQQGKPEKLIEWETKALGVLPSDDAFSKSILASINATIGKAYLQLDKADSATYYNLRAITIFRNADDLYNLAIVLQRQANVFTEKKQIEQAGSILEELTRLNNKIGMGEGDINYHLTFINYYILSGQYDTAIAICREHLYGKMASRNPNIRVSYLEALAKAYKAKGDWEGYGTTLDVLVQVKDSVYATNSAEAIAEMQTKYEVQKKENTIISQRLDITRKNVLFYGSLVLLGLGAIIGWLLFRNYSRKSRMKLFIMQETEKRNAVQAVKDAEENERKRIAADLHDSLGSYAASIKANADEMINNTSADRSNLELLQTNSQQMVSLLGDTIWALRKESLKLSNISDRIKVFLQRLKPNYAKIEMRVEEHLDNDIQLQPAHAYHLFMIVQEAVMNALRHSEGDEVVIVINGSDHWSISVRDDGKGIGNTVPGLGGGNGRYNMQTRAESMDCVVEWRSIVPKGTEVLIRTNTF